MCYNLYIMVNGCVIRIIYICHIHWGDGVFLYHYFEKKIGAFKNLSANEEEEVLH